MAPSTVSSPLDPSRCAAFLADDTPIEVVPAFDLDRTVPLFSASVAIDENGGTSTSTNKSMGGGGGSRSDDDDHPMGTSTSTSSSATTRVSFGPIKAGIPCALPLWLAVALNEKSLAKISKPRWMETDNLVKILQEERTSGTLVVASSASSSASSSNHPLQLPFYYYEISQRLSKLANVGWNRPEIRLLVEDIAQVRIDKLRHTFQKSLAGLSSDAAVALRNKQQLSSSSSSSSDASPALAKARLLPDTFADVTGICAMELAVLGPFFVQALNDVQKMEGNTTKEQGKANQEDPQQSSARDTNDRTASSSSPPPPPRRRDRLRRFR
jgi:GINS complex protein